MIEATLKHTGVFVDIDDALEFLEAVPKHSEVVQGDYDRALEQVRDAYLDQSKELQKLEGEKSTDTTRFV